MIVFVNSLISVLALAFPSSSVAFKTPIPPTILDGVFPSDFIFGTSTSAYQVEGGWLDGGKGLSNWDAFSHTPGSISNGDTGDIANDMYHLYPEDIQIMKQQGLKHYRFSISWTRILPTGLDKVSQEGIQYYNNLINELLANGVEPHVTIFHADIPLALMMYPFNSNPFLDSERFPTWFTDYSQVLFENFGDRVKHWFTFNEPWCTAVFGPTDDVDPYIIAHNAILAHAQTVQLYRTKYQSTQKGTIGIVLNTAHFYPKDPNNLDDVAAAQRSYDFQYGWFIDPLVKGDYPESMKATVGSRLPSFTAEQKELIKGSLDFVGLNYYMSYLVSPGTAKQSDPPSYWKDTNTTSVFDESWPLSQTGWGIYGPGLRDLLIYTAENYNNIPQYVTENGLAWEELTVEDAVNDVMRQQFLYDHIDAVGQAILAGVNVKGYFIWSFQDNLEWGSGYQMHFGVIWIDRPALTRVVKDSLRWYSSVLKAFSSK